MTRASHPSEPGPETGPEPRTQSVLGSVLESGIESGTSRLNRRHALTGAAVVGLGLPLLAACGDDEGGSASADDPPGDPASSAPSDPATSGGASGAGGAGLVATSEVAVGSGVVLAEQKVVVTQPSEGEFKAFSAICTHQGCPVEDIVDGEIHCPCHQSMFSIEDGSPQSGPATTALAEVPITVQGGQILRA